VPGTLEKHEPVRAQADAYPFVENAYQYADLAMQWAAKYGMGVWLGVHAVNGSQNGYEASAPEIARKEIWDNTSAASPTYQNQSLTFVTQLCQRYGSSPALVAVSLMNEPTVSGSALGLKLGHGAAGCPNNSSAHRMSARLLQPAHM